MGSQFALCHHCAVSICAIVRLSQTNAYCILRLHPISRSIFVRLLCAANVERKCLTDWWLHRNWMGLFCVPSRSPLLPYICRRRRKTSTYGCSSQAALNFVSGFGSERFVCTREILVRAPCRCRGTIIWQACGKKKVKQELPYLCLRKGEHDKLMAKNWSSHSLCVPSCIALPCLWRWCVEYASP